MLSTRMFLGDEPAKRQLVAAQRALGLLQPAHADLVEVVLAGCRDDDLHEQGLGAEGAVHGAVQRKSVARGGQLQPLELLRIAYELLLLRRSLRQRLEEVTGHRRGTACSTSLLRGVLRARALLRPLQRGVGQQGPHELAHDVPHLALGLLPLLPRLLLCGVAALSQAGAVLGKVCVQKACEDALRAGHTCSQSNILHGPVRRLGRLGPADGALRDPVLAGLECDRPQHEALPAETVAARQLDGVRDRVKADGALLRLQVGLRPRRPRGAGLGRELGEHEHVAQRLDGRVQLREVRAAEEALP
mmetsp:Transcript_103552/g.292801  ORF Transcript_103552/g.292801 Transcript_103552/m.292801 type:complete len:303 (+) Transcript_103552:355-1263(+)